MSLRKPYIYVMPEAFIKDKDVPARWRILGVLNGFFLSGKKFWGSNEWLGVEIGAHKDTVSQGVKELEELGLIRCDRTRRTRVVYDLKTEIGVDTYLRPAPTPISDRRERLTTSDSNADKEVPADADFSLPIEAVYPEGEDFGTKESIKLEKRLKEAYDRLIKWAEEEREFPFLTTERLKQYKAFKIARANKITSVQLKERWQEMASEPFWEKTGFDWMNVVTSFNKKPSHER